MSGRETEAALGTSIRTWLGQSIREQGRGLPKSVQTAGSVAYLGAIVALPWLGVAAVGPVGFVVGGILGFVLGPLLATAIFRSYRRRPQARPGDTRLSDPNI